MPDLKLLNSGLSIISTCKTQSGDIWEAHFGAAAIAGYFFMKDNDLPIETAASVSRQVNAMVERHHGGSASGTIAEPAAGIGLREAEIMMQPSKRYIELKRIMIY